MYDYIIYEKSRIPFLCGLDLGQRQDYTALVLLERLDSFGEFEPLTWTRPVLSTLHVRYIHRFPRNTTYPRIVDSVNNLVRDPRVFERANIVVDATGVGAPVVDLLREKRPGSAVCPVVITGGDAVNERQTCTSVPKKDLVSSVALLLQQKALVIPSKLPFADILIEELLNFRSTIHPNGNTAYGAWRERDHDDLVLAMDLACWKSRVLWPHLNSGRERLPSTRP
jgi:hypothetical protein